MSVTPTPLARTLPLWNSRIPERPMSAPPNESASKVTDLLVTKKTCEILKTHFGFHGLSCPGAERKICADDMKDVYKLINELRFSTNNPRKFFDVSTIDICSSREMLDSFLQSVEAKSSQIFSERIRAVWKQIAGGHQKEPAEDEELLRSFEDLSLSCCSAKLLPPLAGKLSGLVKLELDCPEMFHVPAFLGAFRKLSVLKIQGDKLRSLPNELSQLQWLTTLSVKGNSLRVLPNLSSLGLLEALTLHVPSLVVMPMLPRQKQKMKLLAITIHTKIKLPRGIEDVAERVELDCPEAQVSSGRSSLPVLTSGCSFPFLRHASCPPSLHGNG